MKFIMITSLVLFLSLLADFGAAQSGVLDISKFGGSPNSDITQAFLSAWKEACAATSATKIVIPSGTYQMNAVSVKGPCKAPIEIQVDGTIQAPANPADMHGADQWVKISYAEFITLSGSGTFDGQGEQAWKLNDCGKNVNCKMQCMNFGFSFLNHSVVKDITSKDSKNFHVNVLGCKNFTFDGFNISAPAESLNTDGIHMGRCSDINIINTNIATGDDCISLGDGSNQVTVENVNCGPGHGISVGSLGKFVAEAPVVGFTVKNCTLTQTSNGLRIKTWPNEPATETISGMHFEDITMVNVSNPIIIDQEYCPYNQCSKKNPSKIQISNVTFTNIHGTSQTEQGVTLICSSGVPCKDVSLNNVKLTYNGGPANATCTNVKPTVTGSSIAC